MQRLLALSALTTLLFSVPVAADDEIIHQARWRTVDFNRAFVEDLVNPEGKTRWELSGIVLTDSWMRTIREVDGGGLSITDSRGVGSEPFVYGAAARDWWMPHLASTPRGEALVYDETAGPDTDRVSVRTKTLGSGWVFLPSGPRQVTLQRSYVQRARGGKSALRPDRVIYRWVDPRAGTVAEVWGRPGFDGSSIVEFEGAGAIEEVLRGGIGLKIYRTEIQSGLNERLVLGFDRMGTCTIGANACVENADCTGGGDDHCTVPISQVVTGAPATMGDVLAQASWNFGPNQLANSRYEIGTTTVAIGPTETCNDTQCGFDAATEMGRDDKNFVDPANAFITLSATEGVDNLTDYTIYLRGGVRHEGISTGALGESESRFCYSGTDTNGETRPEVPLWRFPHNDGEYYMQVGDSWGNTPVFSCEQSLFNHVCPSSCGLFCNLWISGCSGLPGEGQQASVIIDEGPVTLPSGHTFDALLSRQVVDFCTYLFNDCSGGGVAQVHQALYLWVVPNLGTVARMMSEQEEISDTTFTDLQETDVKYGLFPPVSISSTGQTDTTVSISWNPGSVTHHIDGYKVYWDTDSGTSSAYAFDSVTNAGQVNIVGTTATISGLAAGTDYFVTVTALADYANPSAGVTNTFESLLYPTTTGGSAPLPPELTSTTTGGLCTPTQEVTGVTADKLGVNTEFCWTASADPCVDGYEIIRAGTPESTGNYSTEEPDTGLVTCHTFAPNEGFFLILGKGTGGSGPWGHYGM
jgi:hypothetical protein